MQATPITILHLEDSDLDAQLVRDRLERGRLAIVLERVSDRAGFLSKLRRRRYDVILSDYQVPGFDGLAALEAANQHQPATPFLFVSGAMGEELAVETLKRGATDYILKDRLSRLTPAVQRAVVEARERLARRRAEERALAILESMTEAFVALDENWNVSYVNAAFEAMFNVRRDVLLGRGYRDLYPAAAGGALEADLRQTLVDGKPREFEHRYEPWKRWFAVKASRSDVGGLNIQVREITAAKKAEQELRRSEQRLALARQTSGIGFWSCDLPFRTLHGDDTVKAHFHLPADVDITAESFYSRIHPDDREPTRQALEQSIRDRTPYDVDYRTVDAETGSERWIRSLGRATYAPDGTPLQFDGATIDVTERKRTEEALRASEERFRTTADQAPVLIWIADSSLEAVWFNRPWLEFTGRTLEEEVGRGWLEGVHPDDRVGWDERFADLVARRVPFTREYRLRRRDGVYRWLLDTGTPLREADGRDSGYSGSCVDITDRRDAEERVSQLLADEQRHAALLERVAHASRSVNSVLSVDSIARIVTEEARTIIGAHQAMTSLAVCDDWSKADFTVSLSPKHQGYGRPERRLRGIDIAAEVCQTQRPLRLSSTEIDPKANEAGDESSPPLRGLLAAPLIGHGGNNLGIVQLSDKYEGEFTGEDESVLVQLAAIAAVSVENARLYDRLRQQDQRKDEFLATLAHELRNPLAPLRNGLAVMKMAPAMETTARAREIMERQVGHMVRLIDDLLDVSRITRGKVDLKKERVEVKAIIEAALEVSRPLIDQGRHTLKVHIAADPMPLDVDPTRIAQVVSNLLNNAGKYTPEGGRIELSAYRDDGHCVIRVTDNGIGLSTEMLPKVFEMFTQVGRSIDRSQGGLGIGLALVRRLVDMHGGTVVVESPGLGQGCTFTVTLPLAQSPADSSGRRPSSETNGRSRSRKVLVVDDNVDAAASLTLLLELAGHETVTAHSGPEALRVARSFRPEIVFLDIGLPGMNGYEVAQILREEFGDAPLLLVALTGWGADDDRRRALEAGFDRHLTKPVETSAVEAILAEWPGEVSVAP